MQQRHLDTKRLLALHSGDTEDLAALQHLASCSLCKKAFDDSRWLTLLRRLPELVADGPHLDLGAIDAYRQSALSTPRVAEIERHLRSCRTCLAAYQRERAEEQSLDYATTPTDLILKAREAFRPDRQRWLGTVLVTGLDEGPRAVLLSDRRVASGPTLVAGESLAADGGTRESHPASAGSRARRLTGRKTRVPADAESRVNVGAVASASSEAPAGTDELRLEAGPFTVRIRAPHAREPRQLGIEVGASGRPAEGVRVDVHDPSGEQTSDTTNARGRASLAVTRGRSRVVLDIDPPISFDLALLD